MGCNGGELCQKHGGGIGEGNETYLDFMADDRRFRGGRKTAICACLVWASSMSVPTVSNNVESKYSPYMEKNKVSYP